MDNRTANAIILIRQNKAVPDTVTDAEIERLIEIGDKLRDDMRPDVEIEYDEIQQCAIICSTLCEVSNDDALQDFDFEKFDEAFEKEFAE